MDSELFEKAPVLKWNQLSAMEQRELLETLRQSHYYRLLSRKTQAMINHFI